MAFPEGRALDNPVSWKKRGGVGSASDHFGVLGSSYKLSLSTPKPRGLGYTSLTVGPTAIQSLPLHNIKC